MTFVQLVRLVLMFLYFIGQLNQFFIGVCVFLFFKVEELSTSVLCVLLEKEKYIISTINRV